MKYNYDCPFGSLGNVSDLTLLIDNILGRKL